jgi:Fic family protein
MGKPPFELTSAILLLSLNIQEILGELKAASLVKPSVKLRKENKIKTIHHSLAIEGNALSEDQITDLLENKRVIGPIKQIQEVTNALKLYDKIDQLNPLSEKDLLISHSILMEGLIDRAGAYREKNVGIIKGSKVGHVAPQAKMVPALMSDLFEFLKRRDTTPLLLKACIFHYELEFIHPFMDGNGRMGRLWQQLILMKHSPIFEYVSIESMIHKEQKKYYKVLESCDKSGSSTKFIEFSLELIYQALLEFKNQFRPKKSSANERLQLAQETFGKQGFCRKDYLSLHKDISTATASRDLANAVSNRILRMTGDKALARYFFNSR